MGTAQVAAAWGVTEPNVRYWVHRGAPHKRGPNGEYVFDLAEVTAWYRSVRIEGGRGGNRKKRGHAGETATIAGVPPMPPRQDGGGDADSVGGRSAIDELPEEVRALAKLDQQMLNRVLLAQKILTEQAEREVIEGKLVKADDARAAWTRAARSAGTLLRSLSRSLPETLCARLGVEPTAEKIAAAARVIERAVDEVCARLLGTDQTGTDPGENASNSGAADGGGGQRRKRRV